jgi:hypothetical protein
MLLGQTALPSSQIWSQQSSRLPSRIGVSSSDRSVRPLASQGVDEVYSVGTVGIKHCARSSKTQSGPITPARTVCRDLRPQLSSVSPSEQDTPSAILVTPSAVHLSLPPIPAGLVSPLMELNGIKERATLSGGHAPTTQPADAKILEGAGSDEQQQKQPAETPTTASSRVDSILHGSGSRPNTPLHQICWQGGTQWSPQQPSLSLATPKHFNLWASYGTALPWTPVRLTTDKEGFKWLHNERPVHNPPPRLSTAPNFRMRASRSLPSLLKATYAGTTP